MTPTPRTYATFISELCQAAGISTPEDILETGMLNVGGVSFMLAYHGDSKGNVTIFGLLESPPSMSQEACHRRMLEMNLSLMYLDGPRLILDSEHHQAWIVHRVNIATTTGEEFADTLQGCGALAIAWKSGELFKPQANPEGMAMISVTHTTASGMN